MTLDEAIKHVEEVVEEQEKAAKEWHENQVRKCELIPFAEMDYTHENECKKCAEEHRQLTEWLKELKQLREQTRGIPVSERPPEKDKEVLIYIDQSPYLATYEDGEWETEYFTVDPEKEPIAWFELPEPYKKSEE